MLTAALALSTAVLVVVMITLATLVFTSAPPASPTSNSGGSNPGAPALPADRWDAGGKSYGQPIEAKAAQPAQAGDSVERHAKPLEDYPNYRP
jgi:hypothetical protein